MMVRFIADLHLGHKNICEYVGSFRGRCTSVDEHDEWIISQWNSVVSKHDVTWVLGDVAFSKEALKKVKRLNGVKHLVLGNHDVFPLSEYLKYFNKVHGFLRYKGYWLSHAPIRDLRDRINIHGHTHSLHLNDGRYRCVCVEALNGKPISLEDIKKLDN